MSYYRIETSKKSEIEVSNIYRLAKSEFSDFSFEDLDKIFNIAFKNNLFPAINISKPVNDETYLTSWIKRYVDANRLLPSARTAKPKNTCSDQAVILIVQTSNLLVNMDICEGERIHNIFMSAENIHGNLLEEFIFRRTREMGWLWCIGNVLWSTDFCNSDGSFLLQIKNKHNSENSSSNKVRNGKKIEKWYRLKTLTKNGEIIPEYKWEELNEIINKNSHSSALKNCDMNEYQYIEFVKNSVLTNYLIITDR